MDETQLFWNGPTCFGDDITTYGVELIRLNDSQLINMTSGTMVGLNLFNLQPNVEYTVSVSAYGDSCVSAPATVNFTAPAYVSTAPPSTCKCSYKSSSLINSCDSYQFRV